MDNELDQQQRLSAAVLPKEVELGVLVDVAEGHAFDVLGGEKLPAVGFSLWLDRMEARS